MKKILWADDEIEYLKPHIIMLENKGYKVKTVTNGEDAVSLCKEEQFDAVFLDEMMPGKDGLQTLNEIKEFDPSIIVIMITKSEEESIMEEAIGNQISDYLVKPVNPSQIILSLKKNLETKQISSKKITDNYLSEFNRINQSLMTQSAEEIDWLNLYRQLCRFDIDLEKVDDKALKGTLAGVQREANQLFSKFIGSTYESWVHSNRSDRPLMSADIVKETVLPVLKSGKKSILFVFDCLRYDQWIMMEEALHEFFYIQTESYYSILPTATPYSRNAIFSGLFPDEFERIVPDIWKEENEHNLNNHEDLFLKQLLRKNGFTDQFKYLKCLNRESISQLDTKFNELIQNQFTAVVINFIDLVTHTRTESRLIQEMIPDEEAYRQLIKNWFVNSPLYSVFKKLAEQDISIFVTTDHGATRCQQDVKIVGDRETSSNPRYKFGKSLIIDKKYAVTVKDPKRFRLAKLNFNTEYVIAKSDYYMVYPNNYNKFVALYKDSFQHGGISMDEMIVPVSTLKGKS
ncbi:MAG: response regulator [Calditrichaeota bacterium]|nr:response regulator [Calditrichota bacterium]